MKLYSKNLKSIHDLKLEKQRIKNALEQPKADEKTSSEKEGEDEFSIDGLLGNLMAVNSVKSLLSTAFSIAPMLLDVVKIGSIFTNKKTKKITTSPSASKGLLSTILTEFVGGYLKWKAVELAYKGVKIAVKKSKKKK